MQNSGRSNEKRSKQQASRTTRSFAVVEVMAYAECDPTIAAATAELGSFEINTRWSTYIRAIMTRAVDSEGHLFTYDEVWHLD